MIPFLHLPPCTVAAGARSVYSSTKVLIKQKLPPPFLLNYVNLLIFIAIIHLRFGFGCYAVILSLKRRDAETRSFLLPKCYYSIA